MKRAGRQNGAIPSYPICPTPLPHQRRHVKTVDCLVTKVSKNPTNQSKFTGKCGAARCLGSNIHSVYKSKDKAKGSVKLRSVGSHDLEMIGCCPTGTSAIDALAYLARDEGYDDYDFSDDIRLNLEL